MSDCKCKQPCGPCSNNCPDDGEIIENTILDPEDCNTNCCGKKCNDNCGINIQSTNDCLVVDTSECGVIKLTAECPKPTYVKAGDNITVKDVTPPDDCYIDGGDCDVKGGWEVSATDEKVKACNGDTTPGYLDQKLQQGTGIKIDPIGCDGSTNSKLKISIDESILPECPEIPDITVTDNSQLINISANGHHIVVSDQDNKAYYAKMVLAEGHDRIQNSMAQDTTARFLLYGPSASGAVWETVYNKNLSTQNGYIRITKDGLYNVGFSGSAECGSGVHAFRVQLYSSADEAASSTKTLIESRYSAPIGDQPFEVPNFPGAKIHYVSGVSGGGESGSATASYSDFNFKIDTPLWGPATDVEWTQREANGKSASLGSYVSRMPVAGSTIVELKKGDYVGIGVKISSEVRYTGDILGKMDDYSPHFALLCKNSSRSGGVNTGPECGLSFYVDLIHPILSR